ncbi:transposable element gene [Prunus dulcis]|uniref:Transposable element protein n=1 Tax=Prunus dulcis TaxID=3755 RepID=A0A5H2XLN5_PRUDU|nr:transposable element gene [Prunus dulcis]
MMSEMDKSWMHSDRRSKAYEFGVEAFLNFAVENLLTITHIRCPCVKCVNLKLFGVGIIRDHVYFNGVDQSYKNWTFHGEPWEATTNASRNVEEDDGHSRYSFVSEEIDMDDNDFGDFGSDPYEFANVIGDGDQPVYPVAIRSILEKPARYAITRLCFFFNAICAKTVDVSKLDKLEEDVVVTLCLLEKYFPPSFFDIMVHLVVHLVKEVRLCGPVYFRWMYPFERYMKVLKGYVQNRTRPEGCIAERYIAEEAVEFCTQHLSDVSTVGVPSSQKMGVSKPLSGCTVGVVDQDLLNQAHLYILENTEEVLPYIEQHMIHIKTAYPKFRKRTKWLQDKHNSTFIQWLRFKVQSELEEDNHGVLENLRWLAAGPNMAVPLYRSYLIKGIKFNIKAQDDVRTTQNSGVYLLAHTMQVASAKDKNPILSNMGFYGVIQEIWDLDYQKFTIPIFRCDWIDSSGLVVNELGFTLVDLSKIGHRNDQFVLASQVKQIFFVDDPMHRGDVIIECEPFTRGMPNVDTFDELVGELGGQNIQMGVKIYGLNDAYVIGSV